MSALVLASGSASRARLLTEAGVAFVADPADIDEAALMRPGEPPEILARVLAEEKALAVSRRHPRALVLGGDSILAFGAELISKSPDAAAAKKLLSRLSGQVHRIVSAAALARDGQILWRHVGEGRLTMRPLSDEFLDAYLAAESPAVLASVGCYHLEGRGAQLFGKVEGDYFSILGLPLLDVLAALREQGVLKT
jgi:septum formation protein